MHPLVSVIIPAYNAEAYLGKTLQSVLSQSYENLEVIVVDDGSRDNTSQIVEMFAIEDSRVRYVKQPNQGVASARNLGIQMAAGEFIVPIDADDIWYPKAVEKLVSPFQTADSNLGVTYGWSLDIDEQERLLGAFHAAAINGNVHKTLLCHNFLGNASSTLIRKRFLDKVSGYSTEFRALKAQGCEDWDLYLRLAEYCTFQAVPEFLIGYRKSTNNMSSDFKRMAKSHQLMLKMFKRRHPDIFCFLYRFSCGSYYLHFAYENQLIFNAKQTLYWLWQGVKVDPFTVLWRLSFHQLLFRALIQLLKQRVWNSASRKQELVKGVVPALVMKEAKHKDRLDYTVNLPVSRFQIRVKLLSGKFLHYVISKIQN